MINLIAKTSKLALECQELLDKANKADSTEESDKLLAQYEVKRVELEELKKEIKENA